MEATSSFVGKIVGLTIIVLIIVAAALPAITDAQKELISTSNNTAELYVASMNTESFSMTYTSGDVLDINGESITLTNAAYLIFVSDDVFVAHTYSNSSHVFRVTDLNQGIAGTAITSFEVANGEYTTNAAATGTISGDMYYLSDKGTFGLFSTLTDVKFNDTSKIIAVSHFVNFQSTSDSLSAVTVIASGNIKDGMTAIGGHFVDGVYDELSASATLTYEYNENGYYTISQIKKSVEYQDVEYDRTSLDVGYFAPLEYSYYSDSDSMLRSLIGMIPILLVLVPVMIAVRMMGSKNN